MPNYYNPYNLYPASYANQMGYSGAPMQPSVQQNYGGGQAMIDADLLMKWVDGEAAARAFQMPAGWPANKPIPLWDSTDTVIYVKSWGPMGIPNPIQKLKYNMESQNQALLMSGTENNVQNNGVSGAEAPTEHYATKDDLESMKRELMEALKGSHQGNAPVNQNGSNQGRNNANGNRGGNQ